MNFEFTNKQTYLAERAQWTAEYNDKATEIRRLREEYKQAQRAYAKVDMPWKVYRESTLEAKNEMHDKCNAMQAAYRAYCLSQIEATDLIEELHAAKKEAHSQWLAARKQPA